MSTNQLQEKVSKTEGEIQSLDEELARLIYATKAEIVQKVGSWITADFNNLPKVAAARLIQMGPTAASVLKEQYQKILDRVPLHYDQYLAHQELWPHKAVLREDRKDLDTAKKYFDLMSRELISPWGTLLANNKLLDGQVGLPAWKRIGPDKYLYEFNTGMDIIRMGTVNTYLERFQFRLKLVSDLSRLRVQLHESQARDLLA